METLKRILKWLYHWEYSLLCLIVLIILVMHFSVIMQPNEPLFDEIHYVEDARIIISGEGSQRLEHPPLAKLFIVAGMQMFGDGPFGWRFFSTVFGAAGIILMYLICRRLNLSKRVSYLAVFLLALENLSYTMGGIAMLDVFSLTFTLAAFWLYLRQNYVLSGVAVGLSALCKLNGALAILVIGLHWLLTTGYIDIQRLLHSLVRFVTKREGIGYFFARLLALIKNHWRLALLAVAAPIAFIALMPLFDYIIWGEWMNPISQISRMLRDTGSIVFTPDYPEANSIASRPWEWLLPIWYGKLHWAHFILPYWWTPRFLGIISPSITVMVIPAMIYMTIRAIKGKMDAIFPFAWFIGTYLIWIPASLITDRVSYLFDFYPAVGAVCIALAITIFKLLDAARTRGGKLRWFVAILLPLYLLIHVYTFINLAPLSIGQTIPPYIGISITSQSIWWAVPLCIFLYLLMLLYLGIIKIFGFGDSLTPPEAPEYTAEDSPCPAENQVDMPLQQE